MTRTVTDSYGQATVHTNTVKLRQESQSKSCYVTETIISWFCAGQNSEKYWKTGPQCKSQFPTFNNKINGGKRRFDRIFGHKDKKLAYLQYIRVTKRVQMCWYKNLETNSKRNQRKEPIENLGMNCARLYIGTLIIAHFVDEAVKFVFAESIIFVVKIFKWALFFLPFIFFAISHTKLPHRSQLFKLDKSQSTAKLSRVW